MTAHEASFPYGRSRTEARKIYKMLSDSIDQGGHDTTNSLLEQMLISLELWLPDELTTTTMREFSTILTEKISAFQEFPLNRQFQANIEYVLDIYAGSVARFAISNEPRLESNQFINVVVTTVEEFLEAIETALTNPTKSYCPFKITDELQHKLEELSRWTFSTRPESNLIRPMPNEEHINEILETEDNGSDMVAKELLHEIDPPSLDSLGLGR